MSLILSELITWGDRDTSAKEIVNDKKILPNNSENELLDLIN